MLVLLLLLSLHEVPPPYPYQEHDDVAMQFAGMDSAADVGTAAAAAAAGPSSALHASAPSEPDLVAGVAKGT